jgi:putative acetyltransferase
VILDTSPAVEDVRELFEEYSRQIGVDLCVQNFAAELAGLPGNYDALLIARDGVALAGCAGVRRFPPDHDGKTAELKRLYVRENYRGQGLGRKLTQAAMGEAAARGYQKLRLDTLPTMLAAIAMYREMKFEEVEPAGSVEFAGQLFFESELKSRVDSRL